MDPNTMAQMDQVSGLSGADIQKMDQISGLGSSSGPTSPTQTDNPVGGDLGQFSRGASDVLRGIGLGFLPNAAANVYDIANSARSGQKISQQSNYGDPFRTQAEVQQQVKQNPLMNAAQDTAGAASWMVPVTKAGMLARGATGGAVGGLQAFAQPNASLGSVLGGAGIGAATNELLGGLGSLLSGAPKLLARSVIHPVTGQTPGWSGREAAAIDTLLKETSGITPGQIDKNIQGKLAGTTDQILTQLEQNPNPVRLTGANGVNDILTDTYKGAVPGYNPLDAETSSAVTQVNNLLDKYAENTPGGNRVINNPADLFRAKQDLGDLMGKANGAFAKIQKGQPLNNADSVMLAAYDTLKDIIDGVNPGTSNLTEMEHRLYQLSPGVYKAGHAVDNGSVPLLGKLPLISDLLSLGGSTVNTGKLTAARGLNKVTGNNGMNTALQQLGVRLPSMLSGGQ